MDYSAANVSLWNFIIQMGLIAGAVIVANILRRKIGFIRKSLMPIAVMAGFILLILKYFGIYRPDGVMLEMLVYHSIALGFIAMSLRTAGAESKAAAKSVGFKSGATIVGTYLVQGIMGLAVTLILAWTVKPDMFRAAGLLLPMGFGQGPGQANNVGTTYEMLGFTGGRSFGLAIAAAGYLCACTVGVVILNRWAKKGHIASNGRTEDDSFSDGFFQDKNEIPISDSIDKLSVQIAMILVVYLFTYIVTWGITSGISAVSEGLANTVNSLLWGFNFIFGSVFALLARVLLGKGIKMKLINRQYQNNYLLNRISGFFFDIMIVAGIASINLEAIRGLWLPFVLMVAVGGAGTWFYLSFVCKKIYPGYYREGLISMYGMLTGTIGSGVLLLREIDPELNTPAANNLVVGSSYAIVLGAPILVFVSLAAKSSLMCIITFCLVAIYFLAITAVICHKGKKQN